MEKRKPAHDLAAIQATFSTPDALVATGTALRDAAGLGFGRQEIVDTIQKAEKAHFVKSMTSYADHTVWQDVYNGAAWRRAHDLREVHVGCGDGVQAALFQGKLE